MSGKPRILVFAADRGLAEGILRGLRALRGPAPEVDVVLSLEMLREEVRLADYRVVVAERAIFADGDLHRPGGPPVIEVGGTPGPDSDTQAVRRVPLPLSFNLLGYAVEDALAGRSPERDEEPRRRRGSVG